MEIALKQNKRGCNGAGKRNNVRASRLACKGSPL